MASDAHGDRPESTATVGTNCPEPPPTAPPAICFPAWTPPSRRSPVRPTKRSTAPSSPVPSAVIATRLVKFASRHYRWIFNVALRMVHGRADAEDVTHEALVKVLAGLWSFRGDSAFRTWVYRTVKNLVIDRRRKAPHEEAGLRFDGVRRTTAVLRRHATCRNAP